MKPILESIRSRIPDEYEVCFKDSCAVTWSELQSFNPKTWSILYGRYELAVIELDKKIITVYDDTLYIMFKEVGRLYGFVVETKKMEIEKPKGLTHSIFGYERDK